MNKLKKIICIALSLVLVLCMTSCTDINEATREAALEDCQEIATQYFEALKDGDYDTCAELSFYEEDYSDLHDYRNLRYELGDSLSNSGDSYNGYYICTSVYINGRQSSILLYFAYCKAEGEWQINAIRSEYNTVTSQLENHLFEENYN